MQKIDRTGETIVNNYGSKMTIVEYENCRNVTVEFENGYQVKSNYQCFKNREIKSLYDKSVFSIGYIGEGEYKVKIDNVETMQYKYWYNMLSRCYNKTILIKQPTYEDKYVCEGWLNYQVFAKWFDKNWYSIEGQTMQLDKDILFKGNKIYSPTTCVFVPQRINNLFTKSNAIRGAYPIGVYYESLLNKYKAQCSYIANNKKKKKNLGYFNTPQDAFYDGYKPFKEDYIKEVANDYKEVIPKELYESMMNYIVEIDD